MTKVNRGAGLKVAETEDSKRNDTAGGIPASSLIATGRKRHRRRSGSQQEEERMASSPSPYRTRSRSQTQSQTLLQVNRRATHSLPLLKGRTRCDASLQPSKKTSCRGGQRIVGAKSPRRQMKTLHDSGFAMDDEAEDDKALTQGGFSQGSDIYPRVQKVYIDLHLFSTVVLTARYH